MEARYAFLLIPVLVGAFAVRILILRREATRRLIAAAAATRLKADPSKRADQEAALEADRMALRARRARRDAAELERADRCLQRMEDLLVYAAVTGGVSTAEVESELASTFAWLGLRGPARDALARCPNPQLARTPDELRAAIALLAEDVDAVSRTRVLEGVRRLIVDGAGLERVDGYRGKGGADGASLHQLYFEVFASAPGPRPADLTW